MAVASLSVPRSGDNPEQNSIRAMLYPVAFVLIAAVLIAVGHIDYPIQLSLVIPVVAWAFAYWLRRDCTKKLENIATQLGPMLDQYKVEYGETKEGRKFLESTPSSWWESGTAEGCVALMDWKTFGLTPLLVGVASDFFGVLWDGWKDSGRPREQVMSEANIRSLMTEVRTIQQTLKETKAGFRGATIIAIAGLWWLHFHPLRLV